MNVPERILEKLKIANEIRQRPECDTCGKPGIAILLDKIYCGDCYVKITNKITKEKEIAIRKIIEG